MKLFVDTGAWFALQHKNDRHHSAAKAFTKRFSQEPTLLYTTDYIVDETVTLLRFKASHRHAVAFLDFISDSANVEKPQITSDLLKRAETIFRRYSDKPWSYTDCVSFAFMDDLGLRDAFSFDANFAQYGKTLHPN